LDLLLAWSVGCGGRLVQKQQEAGAKEAGAPYYFRCYFNEIQALDLNGPA
jgi:hypothetical protein